MVINTEMIELGSNWKPIVFSLISNSSGVDCEFWPGETTPIDSDVGHPFVSGTGLDDEVLSEPTIYQFRSTSKDIKLTVTTITE